MYTHRFVMGALGALGLLLIGCAHKQDIKPTVPTAAVPHAAPAQTPAPAPEPAPPVAIGEPALTPIHFDFDMSNIHTEDFSVLHAIGEYLLAEPGKTVVISGHCDERGTVEYNIALGDRRAQAARDFLVRLGVDGGRIKTISYGESVPADAGHDESAWAKNRRDEFQLQLKQRAER